MFGFAKLVVYYEHQKSESRQESCRRRHLLEQLQCSSGSLNISIGSNPPAYMVIKIPIWNKEDRQMKFPMHARPEMIDRVGTRP